MASHKVLENALGDLKDEVNSTGAYDFTPKALQVVVAIGDTPDAKAKLEELARYVEAATALGTPYSSAWKSMLQQIQNITPNPPKLADHTGRTLADPLAELRAMSGPQTQGHRVADALQTIEGLCSEYKLSPAQEDAVDECRRQVAEVESRAENLRVDDCQWVLQMCEEGVGGKAFAFLELEAVNHENVLEAKLFAGRLVSVVELVLDEITSQGESGDEEEDPEYDTPKTMWYSIDPPPSDWCQEPVVCKSIDAMCKAIGVAGRDTVILKHKAHTLHVMRPSKDWELYFPVRASRETAQKRLAEFNSNLAKAATKQEKAMTF